MTFGIWKTPDLRRMLLQRVLVSLTVLHADFDVRSTDLKGNTVLENVLLHWVLVLIASSP